MCHLTQVTLAAGGDAPPGPGVDTTLLAVSRTRTVMMDTSVWARALRENVWTSMSAQIPGNIT